MSRCPRRSRKASSREPRRKRLARKSKSSNRYTTDKRIKDFRSSRRLRKSFYIHAQQITKTQCRLKSAIHDLLMFLLDHPPLNRRGTPRNLLSTRCIKLGRP